MQNLISLFLLKNKICTLPGIGTLQINSVTAKTNFLNNNIKSPYPIIHFSTTASLPSTALLKFIAAKNNSSIEEASYQLNAFCETLKAEIFANKSTKLANIGSFVLYANQHIAFTPCTLPAAFLQPVNAIKAIHANAEHQMIVGDKETTNIAMMDYYNNEPKQSKNWWVLAIVLGIIALAIILIFLYNNNFLLQFGNTMSL